MCSLSHSVLLAKDPAAGFPVRESEISSLKDGRRYKKDKRGEEEVRLDLKGCSVTLDKLQIQRLHVMF